MYYQGRLQGVVRVAHQGLRGSYALAWVHHARRVSVHPCSPLSGAAECTVLQFDHLEFTTPSLTIHLFYFRGALLLVLLCTTTMPRYG